MTSRCLAWLRIGSGRLQRWRRSLHAHDRPSRVATPVQLLDPLSDLAVSPIQAAERRWTSAEKEVHARTRVFARYMAPGAHATLADGRLLEQRLRGRIQVPVPSTLKTAFSGSDWTRLK